MYLTSEQSFISEEVELEFPKVVFTEGIKYSLFTRVWHFEDIFTSLQDLPHILLSAVSGCYNKILQTYQLVNKRNLFLTVPEAGDSMIKQPSWLCSCGDPPPGCSWYFLTLSSHGRKGKQAPWDGL